MHWAQTLASILIATVVHESGHFVTARLLGVRVKRCGISWRGFYLIRESGTPLQNAVISSAGPLANLISTGSIFLIPYLGKATISFAFISLLLGVINLLPIPNSDGRRILVLLQNESTRPTRQLKPTDGCPYIGPQPPNADLQSYVGSVS